MIETHPLRIGGELVKRAPRPVGLLVPLSTIEPLLTMVRYHIVE